MKIPTKWQLLWLSLTIAVAISGLLLKHQIDSKTCRAMNDEFEARLHRLKQNAAKRLPIGASKDEVARFFSENNMSLEIRPVDAGREAAGTLQPPGVARHSDVETTRL